MKLKWINSDHSLVTEMIEYVNVHNVLYFCDLLNYAILKNFDWFLFLCDSNSGAVVLSAYIRSRRQRLHDLEVKENETS
ncbi:MAG: hypothetical protein K2I93_07395 [Oscillospiraceae bacterium]|nr:hypothetical protein [Oscillospiraceae bacterium]